MCIIACMHNSWSPEIPFEHSEVTRITPNAGVYRILQDIDYPRYNGSTRIIKIGMSRASLKNEIRNHFNRHVAANRLKRVKQNNGIKITVQLLETEPDEAYRLELQLLRDFEIKHWDLPLLNSTRGFVRGTDGVLLTKTVS